MACTYAKQTERVHDIQRGLEEWMMAVQRCSHRFQITQQKRTEEAERESIDQRAKIKAEREREREIGTHC